MYLDWNYFLEQGRSFVNSNPIKFERITSGYSKGEYLAKLNVPSGVMGDDYRKYLLEKYNDSSIPTYSRFSRPDKEKAKEEYARQLAGYFSDKHKIENNQYFSDLYNYYQNNKEIRKNDVYFDGEVGRDAVDFFNLLDGEINETNWQNKNLYKGVQSAAIGVINTFKELYYFKKQAAGEEWLGKNKYNKNKNEQVKSFKFDVDKIKQVKDFEQKLENSEQKVAFKEFKNNIDLIKAIDLSTLPNTGNVKVGFRKDTFLNGNVFVGRERIIIFPNGEVRKSYFALVELNDIIASHNEITFDSSKDYPTDSKGKNVNDRNYSGDKNAQAKVVSVAQKLNSNIIISTNATASGTPIISVDGIVVSGNNRTMSLKLASVQYKENAKSYVNTLKNELSFGGYNIGQEQVEKFKSPMLVRFDTKFPGYTSTELNIYNKPTGKSEKAIDRSIRLSKQINESENCKTAIIKVVSEQEIVSELYNDKISVLRFKKIMLDCNIITENQLSEFFTETSLTETGKILYETILISTILNPTAIEISQNAGVKSATNSIVNAIMPLIKNKNFKEGSLINEVNNALLIQNDLVNSGIKKLSEFITQSTMFEENVFYKTEKAFIINWFLNQKINFFKNTLIRYNSSLESNQGESIFGDSLSPEEIFNSVFKGALDSEILTALTIYNKNQVEPKAIAEKTAVEQPIAEKTNTEQLSNSAKELLLSRFKKAQKYL